MSRSQGTFVASLFLSAFLLFSVQPLVTKMLLPLYGGSPAVWSTALVFFQTALLAGYAYAHLLTRLPGVRRQLAVHSVVLLAPVVLLPPAVPGVRPTPALPAAEVLALLAVTIGAAFFALSTNSSLIQHWWSRSGFRSSDDPYWLYGASNLGSLVALLAYPFVIEPALGLETQTGLWTAAYVLYAGLTLAAGARALRAEAAAAPAAPVASGAGGSASVADPVTRARWSLWVARAAVGSSLLLSVTMQITTTVASVPLFWVVPLALYLVTYVIAFGIGDRIARGFVVGSVIVGICASLGLLLIQRTYPLWVVFSIGLGTLFFGALLCHGDLARDRPDPKRLTGFYLAISLGGALGGIANSLVAPLFFDSVVELPLTLIALGFLVYAEPGRTGPPPYRPPWWTWALAATAFVLPVSIALADVQLEVASSLATVVLIGALWVVGMRRYSYAFALVTTVVGGAIVTGFNEPMSTIAKSRSFFGVVRVRDYPEWTTMVHGTTIHGSQSKADPLRAVPRSYYHPAGPLGALVAGSPDGARIGVVGLGTGALAALGRPGQEMVFYEIDPVVIRFARDHFSFLEESPARVSIVEGDGRLSLESVPDADFDLLVIDAFSGDFVPTHLLTQEALDLFRRKVTPRGLVALHVSNRHADLRRVLRGYAEATEAPVLLADYVPDPPAIRQGAASTVAAAVGPPAVMEVLLRDGRWAHLGADGSRVLWTDDHVDLLRVLR